MKFDGVTCTWRRGKDVCNRDMHFCTKLCLLPDKFNALQTHSLTLLMASVDRVVYSKDEALE